ncbi:thiamine pyrophosphate-binding protein [Micromonospora sp. NPDC003816]|uniref:thiamine pyrophosphate-binding protein n=1 Tax=Micromonospora sp. NPDC003816 TaxID=3364224 RepID=UPI0036BC28B1
MSDPAVADAVVARLLAWRVARVYGAPGPATAPLVEALHAAGGDPEFVPVRHADSAALMAAGHARFAGGVGVCLSDGGPDALGLLGGLDAARRAGLPVLAVLGEQQPDGHRDDGPRFAGTCRHVRYVADPTRAPELVDEALGSALRGGGPVCLVLPADASARRAPGGPGRAVDPWQAIDDLVTRLPPGGAVTVDGGGTVAGYARHLRVPAGVEVLRTDGAPGTAVPYALAAKLADPARPVLAVVADEGMRASGLAELVAVARHRAAWPDPRLVLLVLNTRSGHPRYAGSPHPPTDDVPYAGWARLLGLRGIRVDRPELVGAAGAEAFGADRPCLLELVVGPAGMDPAGVLRTVGVDSRRSPD